MFAAGIPIAHRFLRLLYFFPAGWKRLPEQSRSRDLLMRHSAYYGV